jgi:hypothetical protein
VGQIAGAAELHCVMTRKRKPRINGYDGVDSQRNVDQPGYSAQPSEHVLLLLSTLTCSPACARL